MVKEALGRFTAPPRGSRSAAKSFTCAFTVLSVPSFVKLVPFRCFGKEPLAPSSTCWPGLALTAAYSLLFKRHYIRELWLHISLGVNYVEFSRTDFCAKTYRFGLHISSLIQTSRKLTVLQYNIGQLVFVIWYISSMIASILFQCLFKLFACLTCEQCTKAFSNLLFVQLPLFLNEASLSGPA